MQSAFIKTLLYILIFVNLSQAQNENQLKLVNGEQTFYLPVYIREGQVYFSLFNFAESMSLDYSYSSKSDKVDIQFDNYSLKTAIRNPFIILKNKQTEKTKIIQLPTTTYFINNNLYLPLNYILPSLREASGWQFDLPESNKLIVKTAKIPRVKVVDAANPEFGITGFSLDEKANGTLVRIKCNKGIATYNSGFKDGVLTIVFRDVNLDQSKFTIEQNKGLIKDIKAKNLGNDCEIKKIMKKGTMTPIHLLSELPFKQELISFLNNSRTQK